MWPPLTTPFKSKTKNKNNTTLRGIQQQLEDSILLGYNAVNWWLPPFQRNLQFPPSR
jgi:hypothetical protein